MVTRHNHCPMSTPTYRALAACIALSSSLVSATLEGVVTASNGAAVEGAAVEMKFADADKNRAARTDGNGVFRLSGLPESGVRVEITHSDFERSEWQLSDMLTPLRVRLRKLGSLRGRVTDETGAPVPGAHAHLHRKTAVGLLPAEHSGIPETAVLGGEGMPVGSNGEYRFYGLPAGVYVVVITSSLGMQTSGDIKVRSESGVDTDAGDIVLARVELTTLKGAIAPVPTQASLVTLVLRDYPFVVLHQVDSRNGEFEFSNIPVGSYGVLVAGPAANAREVDRAARDSYFGRLEVDLPGGKDHSVIVPTRAAGKLVIGLAGCESGEVFIAPLESWHRGTPGQLRVESSKAHAIEQLPPGDYVITMRPDDWRCVFPGETRVSSTSSEIHRLGALRRGRIEGQLKCEQGSNTGAVIEVTDIDSDQTVNIRTRSDGTFSADFVPGRHRFMTVTNSERALLLAELRVSAGQVESLTLGCSSRGN